MILEVTVWILGSALEPTQATHEPHAPNLCWGLWSRTLGVGIHLGPRVEEAGGHLGLVIIAVPPESRVG